MYEARPGLTLRPFAPFPGVAEADEGGGDWSFIDCEMEEVDLQDLPSATIACHLDPRVFVDGLCRMTQVHGQHESEHAGTQTVRARAPCLSHGPKTHSSLSSSRMERVKSPSSRRQKKENFRHDHLLVSQQPPSEISQSLPWASDLEPVRRQRDLAKS
ncbi:uncharacterized protein LOC111743457 [Pteropus vampyrus]|uniref:Uncharacterized protein LOC111743457 n=1 Tax=Pteropus vampyrus TaxID=132908 RepID=A0A6P6CQ34_PTEVA|nr:uncharacterized protein LOC111743457 [Pteropus vampyrus]